MRTTLYLEICTASKLQVKFTIEVWSSRRHLRYRSPWTIEFCGKANWKPKKLWATKLLVRRAAIKRHLLKSSAQSISPERQEPVSLATFRRWVNVFISTDTLWKKKKKTKWCVTHPLLYAEQLLNDTCWNRARTRPGRSVESLSHLQRFAAE